MTGGASCDRRIQQLLEKAEAAHGKGRERESILFLQKALRIDFQNAQELCFRHPNRSLRQNFLLAMANSYGNPRPREFYLLREDALIGRFQSTLTSLQRRTLQAVFDLHQQQWEERHSAALVSQSIFREGGVATALEKPPKTALVYCQYIMNGSQRGFECASVPFFINSAAAAGLGKMEFFPADRINYGGSPDIEKELIELAAFLAKTRPEVVVMDGNFRPTPSTIQPETWLRLKKKFGFKIVCFLGDNIDALGTGLSIWGVIADLVLLNHPYCDSYVDFPYPERLLIMPPGPHDETLYLGDPAAPRDLVLSYVGSFTRQRALFMAAAFHSGVAVHSHIHNRREGETLSLSEYGDILRRSKMFFNNGFREDGGDDVITGRVAEAFLAGTLLLQEVGSPIDEFLVPFVHYVPVGNIHQFVAMAQFLTEDEPRRARIAAQGHRFWMENYSGLLFWKTVIARLFQKGDVSPS